MSFMEALEGIADEDQSGDCKMCGNPITDNTIEVNGEERVVPATVCSDCADNDGTGEERERYQQRKAMYDKFIEQDLTERHRRFIDGETPAQLRRYIASIDWDELKLETNGFYLFGRPGTGKSTMVFRAIDKFYQWCLEDLDRHMPSIKYVSEPDLIASMKREFDGRHSEATSVLSNCQSTGLLVIDELGKARHTEWTLDQLFMLINKRYENLKPTLFASNYRVSELQHGVGGDSTLATQSEYGADTVSRIYEMCGGGDRVLTLTENHRVKNE